MITQAGLNIWIVNWKKQKYPASLLTNNSFATIQLTVVIWI